MVTDIQTFHQDSQHFNLYLVLYNSINPLIHGGGGAVRNFDAFFSPSTLKTEKFYTKN